MKLYSDDGTPLSWTHFIIFMILATVMWLVAGCLPVGFVFLIWGAEMAYITASIWCGFVGALAIFSVFKAIGRARKHARIHGK